MRPMSFTVPERFRMGLEGWILLWRNLAKQLHAR